MSATGCIMASKQAGLCYEIFSLYCTSVYVLLQIKSFEFFSREQFFTRLLLLRRRTFSQTFVIASAKNMQRKSNDQLA